MFIVMIILWDSSFYDTYDFEYSGIEHTTREEAEKELAKAEKETEHDPMVKMVYIVEVD